MDGGADFREKGMTAVREAIAYDNDDKWELAVGKYTKGLECLMLSMKYEKNERTKTMVRDKTMQYRTRCEELKQELKQLHRLEAEFDMMSESLLKTSVTTGAAMAAKRWTHVVEMRQDHDQEAAELVKRVRAWMAEKEAQKRLPAGQAEEERLAPTLGKAEKAQQIAELAKALSTAKDNPFVSWVVHLQKEDDAILIEQLAQKFLYEHYLARMSAYFWRYPHRVTRVVNYSDRLNGNDASEDCGGSCVIDAGVAVPPASTATIAITSSLTVNVFGEGKPKVNSYWDVKAKVDSRYEDVCVRRS